MILDASWKALEAIWGGFWRQVGRASWAKLAPKFQKNKSQKSHKTGCHGSKMDFPGFNGHEKCAEKQVLTLPEVPDAIFDEF